MNSVVLPDILKSPTEWYSVIITSYNTPQQYIRECLESIKCQQGYFGIDIVWVDDGSTKESSTQIVSELNRFKKTSRFTRFTYLKNDVNQGIAKASNRGLHACSSELVFKMDSDDLMLPDRMASQIQFMKTHSDAVICGANIRLFYVNQMGAKIIVNETRHPEIMTWNELQEKEPSWYMNHPTMCYKKSVILSIGEYNKVALHEDYDLLARILKKYGKVYNIPAVLLLYRLHPNQLTHGSQSDSPENVVLRREIIAQAAATL